MAKEAGIDRNITSVHTLLAGRDAGIIRLPPGTGPLMLVHRLVTSFSTQKRTPYRSRWQMPRAMSVPQLWLWDKMSISLSARCGPKLVDLEQTLVLSLLVGKREQHREGKRSHTTTEHPCQGKKHNTSPKTMTVSYEAETEEKANQTWYIYDNLCSLPAEQRNETSPWNSRSHANLWRASLTPVLTTLW